MAGEFLEVTKIVISPLTMNYLSDQVYPVPAILGACIGIVVGNVLGFLAYFRAVPFGSRRVERKAASFLGPSTKSKKKKKK
jgi:uncharacterized integral membrane protein